MQAPQQNRKGGDGKQPEPDCLIESRVDRKGERSALLIPDPIVIRRQHAKRILLRRQVRIDGLAAPGSVIPLPVEAVQPVAEAHLIRIDETQSSVVDTQLLGERREAQLGIHRILGLPSGNLFDLHRRRKPVFRQMFGIDHRHTVENREPEPAILGPGSPREIATGCRASPQPISRIVHSDSQFASRVAAPLGQIRAGNPRNATRRVKP